jgi:hypothetical protein
MTRDEAIKILIDTAYPGEPHEGALLKDAKMMIEGWVQLGMLKIERPEQAEERATAKAVMALEKEGWSLGVLNVLDRAGLKVVEA